MDLNQFSRMSVENAEVTSGGGSVSCVESGTVSWFADENFYKEKRTNKRQQTSIKGKVRYAAVACAVLVQIFMVPVFPARLHKCLHRSRSAAEVFELCPSLKKIPLLENQPFLSQSTGIAFVASSLCR